MVSPTCRIAQGGGRDKRGSRHSRVEAAEASRYRGPMHKLRIAFVQGRPRFGEPERNLEHGLALAGKVRADLVVIPELWSSGYVFSSHAEVATLAEDAERGLTAKALKAAAR